MRNFKSNTDIEIHDLVNQIKHFFDINEIRLIYEFGSEHQLIYFAIF